MGIRVEIQLAAVSAVLALTAGCLRQGESRLDAAPALGRAVQTCAVEAVEEHWPDGHLRLRKEVYRQADGSTVNHGRYQRWYPDGQAEYKCAFEHGRKHGVTTMWHRNGQVWTQDHHVHGVRDGVFRTWDDQGRLRKEEHYCDGLPCGTWTVWNGEGKVKIQVEKGGDSGADQP